MKYTHARTMIARAHSDFAKRLNELIACRDMDIERYQYNCVHRWGEKETNPYTKLPEWTCVGCGKIVNREPKQ